MNYPEYKRFRLFREHKYVIAIFTELLRTVSLADFSIAEVVEKIKVDLNNFLLLHQAHSGYEDARIGKILKDTNIDIYIKLEADHEYQDRIFKTLLNELDQILSLEDHNVRYHTGYKFYLDLRKLFVDLLAHLNYEETVLMPQLQKILSDDEIKAIDHISYNQMEPEQIVHMLEVLVPHFNPNDIMVFLKDIFEAQREKFIVAWPEIKKLLNKSIIDSIEEILPTNLISGIELRKESLKYPWENPGEADICQIKFKR